MEGFTIIDAVVAGVIVLSALLAYSRGFVREAMSIVGWVGAAILAFMFAGQVEPLVKEIPVVGDFLADSCELSIIFAFAAVMVVGLIVFSFITPLFGSLVQRSALGGLDQGLGFLFGVVRGILLVVVALVVYDRVVVSQSVAMVDDSRTAKVFAEMEDGINNAVPEDASGWVVERYEELVGNCGA